MSFSSRPTTCKFQVTPANNFASSQPLTDIEKFSGCRWDARLKNKMPFELIKKWHPLRINERIVNVFEQKKRKFKKTPVEAIMANLCFQLGTAGGDIIYD